MLPTDLQKLKQLATERFLAIQARKAGAGASPLVPTTEPVDGPKAPFKQAPNTQVTEQAPSNEAIEATEPLVPKDRLLTNLSTGISLNLEQQRAVNLIASGKSCCLIGAAGTGKTTTTNAAVTQLLATHRVPMLKEGTKKLMKGSPGIAGIAFTRRASANLRAQMPSFLDSHVMTLHALLEFEPVPCVVTNELGESKQSMRFEPQRHAGNPLPTDLKVILVDEASMLSVDLFGLLLAAIHHPVQFIFIGDIQQLAPVFGEAILGFKLLELDVVELTHVYRQALESPIIRLAHRVLSGKQLPAPEISSDWQHPGQLTVARWPANTSPEKAENIAVDYLGKQLALGKYNPDEDMVLIPFNKHFGTLRMGKRIAGLVDASCSPPRKVIEVVAGFQRSYLAEGDRLLFDNDEVLLKKIEPNPGYSGRLKSRFLEFSRFGTVLGLGADEGENWLEQETDSLVAAAEEGVTDAASHQLTLSYGDDRELVIKTRGHINKLSFAYCTTVHKAQGLQAKKVFLLLHKQHDIMICRELLYTAITRAQKELVVICDNLTFMGGIIKQQIKGKTLAEKAEYFKGKQAQYQEKLQ